MQLWALCILPWALLILSLGIACFNRWPRYPLLGLLVSANVARCAVYLAGWYSWNPPLSRLSAVLMFLAAEESMRRAWMRPWPRVFCAGIGVMLGSLAVEIGEAADPLKSGVHVATAIILAVAVFVSLLNRADHLEIMREALLIVYVVGAIFASKQSIADLWWTILTVESIHVAVLSGFLLLSLIPVFQQHARKRAALEHVGIGLTPRDQAH